MKDGCQSGRKVVPHDSKSDLPLVDACLGEIKKVKIARVRVILIVNVSINSA